jgi:hypothetical protein
MPKKNQSRIMRHLNLKEQDNDFVWRQVQKLPPRLGRYTIGYLAHFTRCY